MQVFLDFSIFRSQNISQKSALPFPYKISDFPFDIRHFSIDNTMVRLCRQRSDCMVLHEKGPTTGKPYIMQQYIIKNGLLVEKILFFYRRVKPQPSFSVITATYNREKSVVAAIDSLLAQTCTNFEHIIVDDGSTDNTEAVITSRYAAEIASGKIVYLKTEHAERCVARNHGLALAKNDWIAYLDSDNRFKKNFLEEFAKAICNNRKSSFFYCARELWNEGDSRPEKPVQFKEFSRNELLKFNYIDLGTMVHHKSLYTQRGGFATQLTRLEDWELALRYTQKNHAVTVPLPLLEYFFRNEPKTRSPNDIQLSDMNFVHKKYGVFSETKITTIIPTYNHEDGIAEAIECAIAQLGNFSHEIIVSDDGSTDNTPEIVRRYAEKYPQVIRNLSKPDNVGISENYQRCFKAATGDLVAICEGGDYWGCDKLEQQRKFMAENPHCTMCFGRVQSFKNGTSKFEFSEIQKNLKAINTGMDFFDESARLQNRMITFSSCMYQNKILQELPGMIFAKRPNELSVMFFFEQYGTIGFVSNALTYHRIHAGGAWASMPDKNKFLTIFKEFALHSKIARPEYRPLLAADKKKKGKEFTLWKISAGH